MMLNHSNCGGWCIVGSDIMSMVWELPVTGPHSLDLALVCLSWCVVTVRCWEPDSHWSVFFFVFVMLSAFDFFSQRCLKKKAARLLVTISHSGPFMQKVWFNRETVIYYSGAAAAPVRPGPDQAPQSCPRDLTPFPFPLLCLNPQYKSQCFCSPSGAYYCLWGIKDH